MNVKKLVVIPSDSIAAYEAKGTSSWLQDYYNPNGYFDEVFVLSPIETKARKAYGLTIIPIKSNKQFKTKLREINPIAVRAYGGYWATDYANFNKVKGIPVVSSVHDTNVTLMYKSLKYSDLIITMSNVIIDILKKKFLADNFNFYCLGNRVDTEVFCKKDVPKEFISKFKLPINKKIIAHVGRKAEEKNIDTVIKSLLHLDNEYILLLVGRGSLAPYNKIIKNHKSEQRIINIEKIENSDLSYLYNLADVVCVPSLWEGFGVVFIEAGACEAKIVTSNIAPMNEYMLNDDEMNILVDNYRDPKVIAESILKLSNSETYNLNTRELFVSKFDKSVIANKEIELYKNVSVLKKNFTVDYFLWKVFFSINKFLKPLFKLCKRIWKKILSYL